MDDSIPLQDFERQSEEFQRPGSRAFSQNGEVPQRAASLNDRRRIALQEIDEAPFSRFHFKICLVTGIGFFTDAYDIFAIAIAAEMMKIVYDLSIWQIAGLKMASSIGNLIGQLLFGLLADIFGRKRMYGVELMIMIIATFGQAISGSGPYFSLVNIVILWRVILGIGIGGDYPSSAVITSEFASIRIRGRLMTAVFAFQGLGQLAATIVALIVVNAFKDAIIHSSLAPDYTWRLLIGLGCVPAAFVLYFRLTVPETPRFKMDISRKLDQAEWDINNGRNGGLTVYDDEAVEGPRVNVPRASWTDFKAHFSKFENLKVLCATAYSWFALDIAYYFLTLDYAPLLTVIFPDNPITVQADPYRYLNNLCIVNLILVVAGLIPGFIASFLFIDIWGRRAIQIMGFSVLTVLFVIMGFDYDNLVHGNKFGSGGLMVLNCFANFFANFGPNTTTFIIPGEVFPTRYRSTAHGISAASGKLGATIAQILFTVAYQKNDVSLGLKVLSLFMFSGVFSTMLIPETKQQTLEYLSNESQDEFIREARN